MRALEPHQSAERIILRPTAVCWNPAMEDDPTDQCAHGGVVFTIDAVAFVAGPDADDITVSAAALFLLRTLTNDHTAAHPVAEGSQLFPHCGFTAHPIPGRFPVHVYGCNAGVDVELIHSGGNVTVRAESGDKATVTMEDWRDAVVAFADSVQAFYDASPPREPLNDDFEDAGWHAFWQEWLERRAAALA